MTELPGPDGQLPPRYRWPWFVLGAVVLAIILFILWMGPAIERIRLNREQHVPNAAAPAPGTNAVR